MKKIIFMTITTLAGILLSGCSNQGQSAQPSTIGPGAMANSSQGQTAQPSTIGYCDKDKYIQMLRQPQLNIKYRDLKIKHADEFIRACNWQQEVTRKNEATLTIMGETAIIKVLETAQQKEKELEEMYTLASGDVTDDDLKEYNRKSGTHYKSMEELASAETLKQYNSKFGTHYKSMEELESAHTR